MAVRSLTAALAVALCCVSLAGCRGKRPPAAPTIGLVTTVGGFGDRSYNDEAAAALAACRRETGIGASTAVPAFADDVEPKLALFATENLDTVVGIGFPAVDGIGRLAGRFGSIHFAIVDAAVHQPNVTSVTFKTQDAGFLAGALAASVTRSRRIAFLGGAPSAALDRYAAGFEAGARQIDPTLRAAVVYAGSFVNRAAGNRAAAALRARGVDVAFVVAGNAGLGAIAEARAHSGLRLIGADSDENALAPGTILASAVKRVDRAVMRVCRDTAARKSVSGGIELGLAEGGVELEEAPQTAAIAGPANEARLASLRRAVAGGSIVPPASFGELRAFRPAAVR